MAIHTITAAILAGLSCLAPQGSGDIRPKIPGITLAKQGVKMNEDERIREMKRTWNSIIVVSTTGLIWITYLTVEFWLT